MRRLSVRQVAGFIIFGALALSAAIATTSATSTAIPELSVEDMSQLEITSALDVTALDSTAAQEPLTSTTTVAKVSRESAVGIAAAKLGTKVQPLRILRGRAPRYSGEPDHSVWIVIYTGGSAPADGPPQTPVKMSISQTGVVVDDETGEVLWWFMR